MLRSLCLIIVSFIFTINSFSQTITTSAISGSPFCAGASVNVPYTITGSFNSDNAFTVQLSDASGGFSSPVNISAPFNSTSAGTITATIPATQSSGTGYRIRVVSSSPSVTGSNNGTNLTINALGLNAPTFTGTTFCAGTSFTLNYTITNSCAFSTGNVFSAELSNASGVFSSPVTIGTSSVATGSGNFSVSIPANTATGSGYRIRVVSSNPAGITSPINASALTINALGINAPTITGGTTSFVRGRLSP